MYSAVAYFGMSVGPYRLFGMFFPIVSITRQSMAICDEYFGTNELSAKLSRNFVCIVYSILTSCIQYEEVGAKDHTSSIMQ